MSPGQHHHVPRAQCVDGFPGDARGTESTCLGRAVHGCTGCSSERHLHALYPESRGTFILTEQAACWLGAVLRWREDPSPRALWGADAPHAWRGT